jgi:hypothetical protein
MTAAALPLLAILLGAPLGFLLTRRLPAAKLRSARFATALLAGAAAMTAAVHALSCLGVKPRIAWPAVAALAVAVPFVVRLRAHRRAAADRTPEHVGAATTTPPASAAVRAVALNAAALVLVAAVLAVPTAWASRAGTSDHDALYIWLPKIAEGLDEAPPDLSKRPLNYHPEYPRGYPQLIAALGAIAGGPSSRLPRLACAALVALLLLAVLDAASSRGNLAGGFLAVALLGGLPLFSHHAVSAYADLPLAAFVLLAVVGLSQSSAGSTPWLAAAAAAAAAAVKDEGMGCAVAVAIVLFVRAIRTHSLASAAPLLALAAVLGPWLMVKSAVRTRSLLLLADLPHNVGAAMLRADSALRELLNLAFGFPDPTPSGYRHPFGSPGTDPTWYLLLGCGLVLACGKQRVFSLFPAGLILVSAFGAFVLTPDPTDWHVQTAAARLALQVLPALTLAAVHRATAPADRAAVSPLP